MYETKKICETGGTDTMEAVKSNSAAADDKLTGKGNSMQDVLEKGKEPAKLVFHKEVSSLEFVEKIGTIDNAAVAVERNKELARIGKELFDRHPARKSKKWRAKKFSIAIYTRTAVLSQNEIDLLLTGTEKEVKKIMKNSKKYERELVIHFFGKIYRIRFPFKWKRSQNGD